MSESARAGKADRTRRAAPRQQRRGPFGRIALFIRQVVAELKKLVLPSRDDLVGYALAVLVFVGAVMAFVTLIDLGVGTLVGWVFGG